MIRQPRVLVFTHDGRGLGHLRRLGRLGSVLQQHASVLFLTGHREASWLVPSECEFIHLPNLDSLDPRRSRQWGRKPFLQNGLSIGRAMRRQIIHSVVETYRPDALVLDYLPLGMDDEMKECVTGLTQCRRYFIVRGILGRPDQVYRTVLTPAALEALREQYHMILVMSDSKIVDIRREYSLEERLADKLVYVGYAAEPISREKIVNARASRKRTKDAKWVVCTAGGGKEGEVLIQRCWELAQIFPECYFDIIVGPRSRLLLESDVVTDGDRVHVRSSETRELPLLHAAADIVISRGGYNSLIESCMGDAAIIVAPIMTDYEQVQHAIRLAKYRDIEVVDKLSDLDLVLERHLERIDAPPNRLSELNMDGLHIAANVILGDIEQHRALEMGAGEQPKEAVPFEA